MTPDIIIKQKTLSNCSEVLQILGPIPVKYFRLEKGKKIEIAPIDLSRYQIFGENENEIYYKLKT